MSCKKSFQEVCKRETEDRILTFDFSEDLSSSELLSGTPTVIEQVTNDLTISNESINTVELDFDGYIIPIGKSVQCFVVGGNVGSEEEIIYNLIIKTASDSTPSQKLTGESDLKVFKG